MPLVIDGGRVPEHWAAKQRGGAGGASVVSAASSVSIALINNMPDSAVEDTEAQFFSLLDAAAGEINVNVQLIYLPDVPRGDRVQEHLRKFYLPVQELWNRRFDGAIITGTEPRQRNLREEPYWETLAGVFDWAEEYTTSTVLSCLAAHASVLHTDEIERHPLPDKQFGVFDYQRIGNHALTRGLPPIVRFPHSRWNEVRADALAASGYEVLDQSADAGVNLFVKKKGNSLFVHFQGHPEYGSRTLLKEYRRDVRRFLNQERETFPSLPHGYFDASAEAILRDFRRNAEARRGGEKFAEFPEAGVTDALVNSWQASAAHIYRNWLQYMISQKAAAAAQATLTPAVHG
jgi:homoserine O-succinyltransferase